MSLPSAALANLRNSFSGDIITPGDDRYDGARRVWNAIIDKRPALIARPRNADDVSACVRFAVEQQLPVAVRGGAHSIAGRGTCDDGIVIDFADMKNVVVDRDARTATAQPGARWVEFDRETQAHGLATTGGTVGDTGIAGLTLGGGFGWLEGKLGMTVDNLLGADVVLATGEFVKASADENPDLFWALRGGGGNFGIVTSFTYRLHEIGPTIIGGLAIHPFADAKRVLTFYDAFMKDAPDELVAAAVLMTAPDGNRACGIAVAWPGDLAEGERIVAPIKSFGSPVLDVIGPMPYLAQQAMLDQAMPPNLLNYWKAEFLNDLQADVIDIATDAFTRVRSPLSSMLFFPIRGAASRVSPDATAFPHRSGYHMGIYSLWNDPAENEPNIQWVRETWDRVKPHAAGGVYVNELGEDDTDRVSVAYGANYDRLARIKARYDPNNVFCLNANILPVAAT
ncbi:MAG TPA: FAD-binding oxidoreductase [Vicinamibacterales bacterium]